MTTTTLSIYADSAATAIRHVRPSSVVIVEEQCEWEGSFFFNVIYDDDVQHRVHTREDAMFLYGFCRGMQITCTLDI